MADDKSPRRFKQEHYDLLIKYSDEQNFTEWNKWYWGQYKITYTSETLGEIELTIDNFKISGRNIENFEIKGRDIREIEADVLGRIGFEGIEFEGAELEGAPLNGRYLKGAVFYEAHLEDAKLGGANLEGTFLYKAYLRGAYLNKANAKNANLKEVKAEKASLKEADLKEANLVRSDLESCDFLSANLQKANLSGADLREARLDQTDLCGADFIAAIVNEGTSLYDNKDPKVEKCKIDGKTQFAGVALASMRIKPSIRTKLEGNIRRHYWDLWYEGFQHRKDRFHFSRWSFDYETSARVFQSLWRFSHKYVVRPFWWFSYKYVVRPFWRLSNYGTSTCKCILTFIALYIVAFITYLSLTWNTIITSEDIGVALANLGTETLLAMFGVGRPALPGLWVLLLAIQVIFGYFLLAVIVVRLSIMFQSLSP